LTTDRSGILLAIPVFNDAKYIERVLGEVARCARDILVIDDGSTDETPMLLANQQVEVIRHAENRGYGRSVQDMLRWAEFDGFDWLITMDCDEQHEPAAIPEFIAEIERDRNDVISGSRYLAPREDDDAPPNDRRVINARITEELNQTLGLDLTDAFCGFKAYRIAACQGLQFDVDGYEFPMQFWVQAVANGLSIHEIPVRLIYNDPSRSFGGPLDDAKRRMESYRATMHREFARCAGKLSALRGS
jgi:dolichol-phosphate mannosyltransferase